MKQLVFFAFFATVALGQYGHMLSFEDTLCATCSESQNFKIDACVGGTVNNQPFGFKAVASNDTATISFIVNYYATKDCSGATSDVIVVPVVCGPDDFGGSTKGEVSANKHSTTSCDTQIDLISGSAAVAPSFFAIFLAIIVALRM
eukprot:TRINITY_DN5632_c0_g1_i19.p1 TRINITY_DN5632_c0_g1~~TRINITY_DN5632_c0_g1_i19.p1  ORF type:complete len:146 (-),score=19.37 TRINITY_DN5632_c0_g1_i19:47-484(-)